VTIELCQPIVAATLGRDDRRESPASDRTSRPARHVESVTHVSTGSPAASLVVVSSYGHPGSVSFVVNVEARKETMTEVWPQWQGEVINGVYPLRRLLNGSDHSAVFLTECKAQDIPNAAIKFVPAERVLSEVQLSHWRTAASLSHPHLIRLLDAGHCQLGGRPFLFVVMEYAEQTLAQVLPHRALTPDEVREMLLPTLDALAFLHRKNLVQGQLKPANLLVVNDQLKLASDTVRPAGEPRASITQSSLYDPPEAKEGRLSPASDIWGLGITMVEALTQSLPWPDERSETASLPATLPPTFVDIVQRCLSHDPASRPTATDLAARFKRAPQASVVSVPQAVVRAAPRRAALPQESSTQRWLVPTIVGVLMLLVAVWAGLRLFRSHPNSQPSASSTLQTSSQQTASAPAAALPSPATPLPAPPRVSAPAASAKSRESRPAPQRPVSRRSDQPAQPLADASPAVVHEEIPNVPRSARKTIHGHIKVAVLVIVDRSGNVIDALLQNPGPSWYFARVAREAARKWRFAPADKQDSRQWLLRFEFTRGGATGHAAAPRS
jgi:TonB family protein